MKTQQISNYFRASIPVVAIESPSPEEQSVIESIIVNVAIPLKMNVFVWNLGSGLQQVNYSHENGIIYEEVDDFEVSTDPILDTLNYIGNHNQKAIFILVDLQPYIGADPNRVDYAVIRKIKNLCFSLKNSYTRMILMGQGMNISNEFDGLVQHLNNELPNQEIIKETIREVSKDLTDSGYTAHIDLNTNEGERLIRACQGLTIEEIKDAMRISIISDGNINYQNISDMKIQKLQKMNVEFCEAPDVGVGGLGNLKEWLHLRSKLFSAQVTNTKLPSPKGIMLVGVPGTGKSLIAKTIGQMWSIPILKLDMGSIYNSLVGESEKNMRQLLKTAEAVAPCVLWMDEIEKGLSGASGGNDSGVSQRVFGQFLTWMSEHKAPVFVVATANDISSLPPELSRKGRFDEVFFVDLPHPQERIEILTLHLNRHDVKLKQQELAEIAKTLENYSGAEIAGIVDDGAIASYSDNRYPKITIQDLQKAISSTVPLAEREKEKIKALRNWAVERARFASVKEEQPKQKISPQRGSKQIQMM